MRGKGIDVEDSKINEIIAEFEDELDIWLDSDEHSFNCGGYSEGWGVV